MKKNEYKGKRYVPKIIGGWDYSKRTFYESLSIVTWQGCSYTSKKDVPIGIDIYDEKYWALTGNYNAQVEIYRKEVKNKIDKRDIVDNLECNDPKKVLSAKQGMTLNAWVEGVRYNVKRKGAKGDGVTDDTLAIQNAIDYCLNNGLVLYFPSGAYIVTKPLNFYKNGVYTLIDGSGRRSARIIASAPMDYLIKFWSEGVHTAVTVRNVGFYGGDFATTVVDAFKTVYSIFDDISIWSNKENAYMMKISSWCNRVTSSLLNGNYGNGGQFGIVPCTAFKIDINQSVNNLMIENNVITLVDTAFECDIVNDLHIQGNTIDTVGKVIVAKKGMRSGSFRNNYCEVCGGTNKTKYTNKPITYKDGAYSVDLNSPFILTENPSMGAQHGISFIIEGNQFANCYQEELVALSGVRSFIFKENDFYGNELNTPPYTYNNIIRLIGKGVYGKSYAKLKVENRYPEKIPNMIKYDINYGAFYLNNGEIVIEQVPQLNIDWYTSAPTLNPSLGGQPITPYQEIVVNATKTLRIDFDLSEYDKKQPLKIRVNVEKRGGTKIIYDLYAKPSTALVYQGNLVTGANLNDIIVYDNERDTKQYKNFFVNLKSDGDIKIKSVILETVNPYNRFIRLI